MATTKDNLYYMDSEVVAQVATDIKTTANIKLAACKQSITELKTGLEEAFVMSTDNAAALLGGVITRIENNISVLSTEMCTTSTNLNTLVECAKAADARALALQQ